MNIQDAPISPKVKAFLNVLLYKILKSKQKNDITIRISDPNAFLQPSLGFSVKSQLGGASTLVNASGETNFVFNVKGAKLNPETISEINHQKKYKSKLDIIKKFGASLEFECVESEIFKTNLQVVNHHLDLIFAKILLLYYKGENKITNTIPNYVDKVADENPLGYNLTLNSDMYKMMMKAFLKDYALGMRAGTVWKREYEATGGYIVVRPDGELICYHFYFAKEFEEYLYHNTKMDTPSGSKHGVGVIYEERGQQKMRLSLQIRFIK